ncbi:DedA family protein [Lactobacillus pasteurii]|uniref:Alkaline phosphatase n=1 Tax=Lactobacillus pasteurii DSM 23907 = CRBIP 24.76 TaxID=1423790 RepID=I7KLG0_9LACO|nr:DedA family protein [Lactobacillus pasteurii]TDG76539.1 hypothetical protein C5L33_001298 [Lactobacillus pasteurii]CCI85369.1 Alkaline phosphatase [Lactobacillus pasteurii DSM 23907 = CRBIP 24.76]
MISWIIHFINQFGYLAVILLIALEGIIPPIPSEVILAFSGFLSTQSKLNLPMLVISSTIGSLVGALVLYLIGYLLNEQVLEKLVSLPFFKKLGFKKGDVSKAIAWFDRYGTKSIFFGRFIPIVRSLISIPAGTAKVSMIKFLALTFWGSLIWNSIILYLGQLAGENWGLIVTIIDDYAIVALIIFIVLFAYLVYKWYQKRIKN